MNIADLQRQLRHFAAERDWQPFHTPKNLATALMVEAAELAEIFQWLTPRQSQAARLNAETRQRIADELADVLLYLLQLADHCQIDLAQAVPDKLVRNALKHPAKRRLALPDPSPAAADQTQVLLDLENVQPTQAELLALVPDAAHLWLFHGPHQHDPQGRYPKFVGRMTVVPITKTGKNALDFLLTFHIGRLAAQQPVNPIVVLANDKGYQPVLDHVQAMGLTVKRLGLGADQLATPAGPGPLPEPQPTPAGQSVNGTSFTTPVASRTGAHTAVAKTVPAKSAPSKLAPAKKAAAKKSPAKKAAAKKAAAKKAAVKAPAVNPVAADPASPRAPVAKKVAAKKAAANKAALPPVADQPALSPAAAGTTTAAKPVTVSADKLAKIITALRNMADKRPVRAASLRRALKSYLGAETGDDVIEVALHQLIAADVVSVGADSGVRYPGLQATPHAEGA